MDNGNLNATEQQNVSQLCPSVFRGPSSALFDLLLSSLGLSVTLRRMWLMLQTKNIDLFQFNFLVFHVLNSLCLLLDFIISYILPESIVLARVVILGFVLTGGSLILCCICIERYIAVVHPIQYQQHKSKRIKEIGSASVWIITLTIPQAWERNLTLTFKLIASIFLITVLVMIWCNNHILRALKKSGPGRDEMHPVKVRAFNRVRIISLTISVFYFPAAVTAVILAGSNELGEVVCLLIPLCILLCSCACLVHPAIKLFRKGRLWCTENLTMNCKI